MASNRKKSFGFRFNGLHEINTVQAEELQEWIDCFEAKLADPNDADDKKWTRRWIERFKKELAKKLDSQERRQRELAKDHGRKHGN